MFARPQLIELINRTREDLLSRLTDNDVLRRSDAEVYARVLAGGFDGIYGYLDWLSRQVIYDTADTDMLERWAEIWGITRKAASKASGTLAVTGANGATLPAGSVFQTTDQTQYTVLAEVTIAAGVGTASVEAVVAGAAGNRASGETLTITGPAAGITSTAINATLSGGADTETDADLRARFLARIRQPPQGGASRDYVQWALEVPGFTRAWCYAQEAGAGTVTVRGMCDLSYTDGIPQTADINALQTHLDIMRPVTATVYAVAPIAAELDFEISGLSPNTTAVKSAIETALADLILSEGEPGATLLLSHIQAAVANAGGVYDFSLVSPAANVAHGTGEIPVMGAVTWS